MATRRQNWGEDRVMFFDEAGRLRSLLASWTNVDEPDVFSQAAGGRSFLRVDDLANLAALIDEMERARERPGGVK
jgi:Family of unknown function (DUF5372)